MQVRDYDSAPTGAVAVAFATWIAEVALGISGGKTSGRQTSRQESWTGGRTL